MSLDSRCFYFYRPSDVDEQTDRQSCKLAYEATSSYRQAPYYDSLQDSTPAAYRPTKNCWKVKSLTCDISTKMSIGDVWRSSSMYSAVRNCTQVCTQRLVKFVSIMFTRYDDSYIRLTETEALGLGLNTGVGLMRRILPIAQWLRRVNPHSAAAGALFSSRFPLLARQLFFPRSQPCCVYARVHCQPAHAILIITHTLTCLHKT